MRNHLNFFPSLNFFTSQIKIERQLQKNWIVRSITISLFPIKLLFVCEWIRWAYNTQYNNWMIYGVKTIWDKDFTDRRRQHVFILCSIHSFKKEWIIILFSFILSFSSFWETYPKILKTNMPNYFIYKY